MHKFITIEGSEGAGKSTALQFIATYFNDRQLDVVVTREPGGTPIAEKIRQVLLDPNNDEPIFPQTELLLMFAGRVQHIHACLRPALLQNKWVVSDRYIDATYAYQGNARGLDADFIALLDKKCVGSYYPALTLLLDIPAALGLKRTEIRQSKDRIEKEKIQFFENVRAGYLARAQADPARIKVIDASQSIETVHAQIKQHLDEVIKRESGV